ncbi:LuxR C-terminal-related transcriptional regulator [Kitasatospora sp. NBC_01560]|uniref:helix-turn-helix transcriptional regulator n=1 Tax=Kitasatospora sp. NBC_01560 TaxID=2975965 RepID=UPI003867A7E1
MPALTDVDAAVYHHIAESSTSGLAQICADTGLGFEQVADAIDRLSRLRLVSRLFEDPIRFTAVSPDSAKAKLLDHTIRDLLARQQEVDQVRTDFDSLREIFEASERRRLEQHAVEQLDTKEDIRLTIRQLVASVTSELIICQPGGAHPETCIEQSLATTEMLLNRGVRIRTLYQHTAQYSLPTISYVERVSSRGAEVRTVSDYFGRLLVFDNETAVIELADKPDGFVLVRDRSLIKFTVDAFEHIWSYARPFLVDSGPSVVSWAPDATKATIVRLLTEGLEDKVIARRLGISLRTCQRHVSEIMVTLGARNRFHAGYLIHRAGLLDQIVAWPPLREPALAHAKAG